MSKPTQQQLQALDWWRDHAPVWAEYYSTSSREWGADADALLHYRYLPFGETDEPGWGRFKNVQPRNLVYRPERKEHDDATPNN